MKNKKKTMFADLSIEERQSALMENCVNPDSMQIRRHFTPTEIAGIKERQVTLAIGLDDAAKEKSEYLKEHNAEIKPVRAEHGTLVDNLRKKYIDEERQVYLFDNQEDSVMEYYDEDGIMVYERALLPTEKQTSIRSIKTGTDN